MTAGTDPEMLDGSLPPAGSSEAAYATTYVYEPGTVGTLIVTVLLEPSEALEMDVAEPQFDEPVVSSGHVPGTGPIAPSVAETLPPVAEEPAAENASFTVWP
ncbi:MAG TPA: hypothetical protein VFJ93_00145 [Gaiellaceae bacterium]|nr:hypothetical protein [Gaiellaceae bacterium]